jgi:hypothetical protein
MKPILYPILILLIASAFAEPRASEIVIFSDDFAVEGAKPGALVDPNLNPDRQKHTANEAVSYQPEKGAAGPGSAIGIEVGCGDFEPSGDVLLLRNLTAESGLTMCSVDLQTDFGDELSGKKWALRYDALLTTSLPGNPDNWLAVGFGSKGGGVDAGGSGQDAFTFGIRTNGQWLLWYRDPSGAQQFLASQGIAAFTAQQQYRVEIQVDDTGANPLLTIDVIPQAGQKQNLVSQLEIKRDGGSAAFEFRTAVISNGAAGEILDGRLDNVEIALLP